MTKRRGVLVAAAVVVAVIAVIIAVVLSRSAHRAPAGCDTVHAMLDDNSRFRDQAKESAAQKNPDLASDQQYRDWAVRMKDYATAISDPELAGKAQAAADTAGRIADLVPRYRAKPDDKAIANDYINIGIEFGNAINRLEYACLPEA